MHKQALNLLFCFTIISLCPPVWADNIYKCKNAKGVLIYGSSPCAENVETLDSWTVTHKARPPSELVIKQNNAGHYQSEGSVNGQAVAFVVDTGATKVSLPISVAQAANINCQDQVEIHTANGKSQACAVLISQFKFGPFSLQNVEAIIAPNLNQPLLGMNVLQQFKIAQELGEMHISERH